MSEISLREPADPAISPVQKTGITSVTENRTLDFKQELVLNDSGKLDFLGALVAVANASGGTIIDGAVEGEDEMRGQIVALQPMPIDKDYTETTSMRWR